MKKNTFPARPRQRGAVLFIMIMILIALSMITLMATNMGKSDMRISNAYAEQSKAFIKAEEMLARLRYALEQLPLPEGIAVAGAANSTTKPIWKTQNLAKETGSTTDEPDFTNPLFAHSQNDPNEGWTSTTGILTCQDVAKWMQDYAGLAKATVNVGSDKNPKFAFEPLDCAKIDPDNKTRSVIELINKQQNEGDLDELHDTYYYRITVYAQGNNTGRALVQGVTGIQYN